MSFDRVARSYWWMERLAFGRSLERARTAMLDDARHARRALILGEGDGRFLSELLRANPEVEVDCVDRSAQMLELARARIGDEIRRVRFFPCDALAFDADRPDYDLVVTHFFFDCIEQRELTAIVAKLGAWSVPRAIWLMADFVIPRHSRWRRFHARAWLWLLYTFFRITAGLRTRALVDPTPHLESQGYRRVRDAHSRFGMLSSATWRRG